MNEFVSNLQQLNEEQKEQMLTMLYSQGEDFNIYRLSSEQSRLWFLYRLNQSDSSYNITFTVNINGRLNRTAFNQALTELVSRQSVLRTTFFDINGEAFQLVNESQPIELDEEDISGSPDVDGKFTEIVNEEYRRTFQLEQELPVRMRLIKKEETKWSLLVVIHHINCDGWSMGIFCKMLRELYKKYTKCEYDKSGIQNVVPYFQYAVYSANREKEKDRIFWKKALEGASFHTTLPYSYPERDNVDITSEESIRYVEKSDELLQFCKKNRISMFSFLLGVYGLVLQRLCDEDNITVGTPALNRSNEKWQNTIGFFANTIVFHYRILPGETISSYFQRVNHVVIDGLEHGEFQFDELVDLVSAKRLKGTTPVISSLFALQNSVLLGKSGDETAGDVTMKMESPEHESTVQFNLLCTVIDEGASLKLHFVGRRGLFSKERMEQITYTFEEILKEIIQTSPEYDSLRAAEYTYLENQDDTIEELKETCCQKLKEAGTPQDLFHICFICDAAVVFYSGETASSRIMEVMKGMVDSVLYIVKLDQDNMQRSREEFYQQASVVYKRHKELSEILMNDNNIHRFYIEMNHDQVLAYVDRINKDKPFPESVGEGAICDMRYESFASEVLPEEEIMLAIWKEVLEREEMSTMDNFFAMGGKSVKMVELFEKINVQFPGKIIVNDIFTYPTVHQLVQYIVQGNQGEDGTDEGDEEEIICL